MKTSTKRKAIIKEAKIEPKKRGRPVGSKKIDSVKETEWDKKWREWNEEDEIDVPLHLRGGEWKWNFEEEKMPLVDKITWILTVVNVAILISLIIKNV